MLTFRSNQPGLKMDEAFALGQMMTHDETNLLAENLKQKRSIKGPLKNPDDKSQFWSRKRINEGTIDSIKTVINEKILEKDQIACKNILKKIVIEKEMQEMEKQWHQLNRDEIRRKFVERHEQNIRNEERAGIKREYEPLVDPEREKWVETMEFDNMEVPAET